MPCLSRALLLLATLAVLTGCSSVQTRFLLDNIMGTKPLKVGIVADLPPLAYTKNAALTGLEIHLASGLAESIGSELELVVLPREDLAPALKRGKIDIIMAGMTVTEAHQHTLATASPYFLSGQTTLVRLSDYDRLGNGIRHLTEPSIRLGVVAGSTADRWLKGLRPKGTINRFASAQEGVQALVKGRIDVFIYRLTANFYYASLYIDKGLTPGNIPLTREELAWAVRPDDTDLRQAANAYLSTIKQNGELQNMLDRFIPFYRNTAYSPKQ